MNKVLGKISELLEISEVLNDGIEVVADYSTLKNFGFQHFRHPQKASRNAEQVAVAVDYHFGSEVKNPKQLNQFLVTIVSLNLVSHAFNLSRHFWFDNVVEAIRLNALVDGHP